MDAGGCRRAAETNLFKPKDAYRMAGGGGGGPLPATATVGRNPAAGVGVYYYLKMKRTGDVQLEFLDQAGKSIRKFTGRAERPGGATSAGAGPAEGGGGEGGFGGCPPARVSMDVGLNRVGCDMRYAEAARFPGMILWAGETRGPKVAPGAYQVKLTVDGKTYTQNFEVKADPRVT